ncbi:hypothetical protein C8J47_0131 [Sphingomonas sp. PP-F2F-G114-C0414]|uniref:hypothetical protein n=1 Tax=Sphingomonas sp. PP-F2F-G114-C0414 TaxID=2135662 RepID=UPI000F29FD80|nr:hypothetical protein [Sphingomonas sp. PP-F2F-G114-C0414]RMB39168.1 hypothetical protein C8J47_0131 [Sphingomonas sp. PP-F2F-G114-C0414]
MSKRAVPSAMTNETKHLTLGKTAYEADRITDGTHGIGYIELRRPGSSEPLARINYHGPGTELDLCTYGTPLPMSAVEWLIEKGREKLA